jgi:hypothetical protein
VKTIHAQLPVSLPSSTETGKLNIMHIKRYWAKSIARRNGQLAGDELGEEWKTDTAVLSALGLGLEQTARYLFAENPSFDEFEEWILQINGGCIEERKVREFNTGISNTGLYVESTVRVLSDADMEWWNNNGYIILRNAVPLADCEATIDMICDFLEIQRNDPSTWYRPHPSRQGIMVQLFQHPLLQRNRESAIIKAAYEQLWRRKDIWVNTDRVGFNPPETETYHFPGPRLHWDVSLELPIPFGLQGILYLSDTKADQGAFTLVPGFHNRIDDWIHSLPQGANPRTKDLYALGAVPVAASAGDFIIWHHALPHGSSPNTSAVPRIVQYINYSPLDPEIKPTWK